MSIQIDRNIGAFVIAHALTIDVEHWYHAENMRPVAPPSSWAEQPSHLHANVARILELFSKHDVQATFFVLGSSAEREPRVVEEIAAAGHEVACHGWSHDLIYRQTPELFREETRRAKAFLEDLAGAPVLGYRASTFSVVEKTLWALDILTEEGFAYDASIAPLRHDRYGIPDAPIDPHMRGGLAEFPVSSGRLLGKRFPVGGGFFRLFPLSWAERSLRAYEERGRPGTLYLHPWEFDPDQPRQKGLPFFNRFRHYANLKGTYGKLDRLLKTTRFTTMEAALRSSLEDFDSRRAQATR